MKRIEMKNYNMISTEKQQIYQHYHQVSGKTLDKYEYLTGEETVKHLTNMNILQLKKHYLLIKVE